MADAAGDGEEEMLNVVEDEDGEGADAEDGEDGEETLGDLGLWGGNEALPDPDPGPGPGPDAPTDANEGQSRQGSVNDNNSPGLEGSNNNNNNNNASSYSGTDDMNTVSENDGGWVEEPAQDESSHLLDDDGPSAHMSRVGVYGDGNGAGLIDLNDIDIGLTESTNGVDLSKSSSSTQTMSPTRLSFEDPMLFKLDEILGPDREVEYRKQQSKIKLMKNISDLLPYKKRGRKTGDGQRTGSWSGSESRFWYGSGSDLSEGQEEYDKHGRRRRRKGKGAELDGEGVADYAKDSSSGSPALSTPPPAKSSLTQFEELYMKLSDTCTLRQLSHEVIHIPSRESTPSPPATPDVAHAANICPSIESFFKLADKVKINFHVLPGRKIYSKDVRLDRTFGQIKEELAQIVKVPATYIELRRNKNLVMDYKTLKDVGGKPGKKMRFTIEVNKRALGFWQLKVPTENKLDSRPEVVRSVRVQKGRDWKTLSVSIEFASERKLFIGGYRDKLKGTEHHHASSQTPLLKVQLRESQLHKCTQAFRETGGCSQTMTTTYTQVERPDYYPSCLKQRLVYARSYETACRLEMIRKKSAIIIQKYWRRWLAIKERDDRMAGLVKRVEWAEQVRKGRTETRLAIKDDEMYRQYNPTNLLDLELLYRAINAWRKQEVDFVLGNRWGAEKKAALADIMEKEADLLLDLERAKSKILNEKNSHLVEDLYRKMGAPTRWLTRTGQFITLDTPDKAKARILHDMYHLLQQSDNSPEERLKLLDKLYKLIKDHRTVTSDYLVQLIGREITLMQRNARERLLIGLRKRILNGFFALCRDNTFNSEAKTLQKIPFDVMKLRKDMVQCKGCRKMLYRDQFTISHGVTVTNRCLTCMGLYRTCILRVDLNLYRRMLQELRQDEQEQGVGSSIAYLIDAYDLQFLIEKLWHGQSALSGIDDRYLLRLCRWLKNKPWTPWNCVLLTEEESVAHLHIEDMKIAYQQSFFEKVRLRHNAARSYFERTSKTSLGLDTNLQMYCMAKDAPPKPKPNTKNRKFSKKKTKSTTAITSMKI